MQDKKPLNKTNYTARQNGSLPNKTADGLWWEKKKITEWKENVPHPKNYQHHFSENVPQNMVLTFKDCVKAGKDFGDKQQWD